MRVGILLHGIGTMDDCSAAILARAEVVRRPQIYLGFADWIAWGWGNQTRVRMLLGPNVKYVFKSPGRYMRTYACVYVRTYSIVACKLTSWRPNQYAWVLDDYVRTYVRRRLPTYAWILSYIGEHTLEDPVCLEQCPMFCIRTCHYVHSPANSSMLSGSLFMYVCVSIFPFFIFAKL